MNAFVLNIIHFFPALFYLFYSPTTRLIIFLVSKQVISYWIFYFLWNNVWGASENEAMRNWITGLLF